MKDLDILALVTVNIVDTILINTAATHHLAVAKSFALDFTNATVMA